MHCQPSRLFLIEKLRIYFLNTAWKLRPIIQATAVHIFPYTLQVLMRLKVSFCQYSFNFQQCKSSRFASCVTRQFRFFGQKTQLFLNSAKTYEKTQVWVEKLGYSGENSVQKGQNSVFQKNKKRKKRDKCPKIKPANCNVVLCCYL